jgi:hypothetical protein
VHQELKTAQPGFADAFYAIGASGILTAPLDVARRAGTARQP